ncbi:MAG: hypothetical protein AAFU66_10310 [Pseudomonadota bacterium]
MHLPTNKWLAKREHPTEVEVAVNGLLARIAAICTARNWTEGYFGKTVAGDDQMVSRLRDTGRVHASKLARLELFLREQEASEPGGATVNSLVTRDGSQSVPHHEGDDQ